MALITGVVFERKGDMENSRGYYNEALGRINILDTTDINIFLERNVILMLLDKPIDLDYTYKKINQNRDSVMLRETFNKILEADKNGGLSKFVIPEL